MNRWYFASICDNSVIVRLLVKQFYGIDIHYIPRNMHTVFALLCFVVVIHWLIFTYPSGLLHWHCGNLTITPVPAKQPWWIWINTSCEFIMNDCITTTTQSTTKPCAYLLGYTVTGCTISKFSTNIPSSITKPVCLTNGKFDYRQVSNIKRTKSQHLRKGLFELICFIVYFSFNFIQVVFIFVLFFFFFFLIINKACMKNTWFCRLN